MDPLLTSFLAVVQWRPRLEPAWCGLLLAGTGAWMWWNLARLKRRFPAGQARLLMVPQTLFSLLLAVALFNPVTALEKSEKVTGKLLVLTDVSSSMEVADDGQRTRLERARNIVRDWKNSLSPDITLDELEFDTTVAKPGSQPSRSPLRETDLAGCLLSLASRADIASYLGVVLLTDGGDELVECAALPPIPLSIVGMGTDPSRWNDLAVASLQAPATAELNVDFEMKASLVSHAGGGGGFAGPRPGVQAVLELETTNGWTPIASQPADLTQPTAQVVFPVPAKAAGIYRYRLNVPPVPGELSTLNNTRFATVEVRKKALHVLYFALELGQEFKMLRNEIGRDPGLSFTAMFRAFGDKFTIQGSRAPGDEGLAAGLPSKKVLALYDAVILGSFPAADCSASQMRELVQYVDEGGVLVFLGGDKSFGHGGYAPSPLATLFPWRIAASEGEPRLGNFPLLVPPAALGHPILASVEDLIIQANATLESVNLVQDLKPGALALMNARLPDRQLAAVAVQPYGKGKVLGVASNTFWKWATQSEALRLAYGLFWRQALRILTGKEEGGQNIRVQWDREFYRPGEQAVGTISLVRPMSPSSLRFSAFLDARERTNAQPVAVEPMPGQTNVFAVKLVFHERGERKFRLAVYENDRVVETCEKMFRIAPRASEGSRLELDAGFLKKLARQGGGEYLPEAEAGQFVRRYASNLTRKRMVVESALIEAGPAYLLLILVVLGMEWALRRRMNLI